MAGLPCTGCGEETTIIPSAQVLEDESGQVVYRRYRCCTTPDCDLYLLRRVTVEVYTPLEPNPKVFLASMHNLRKLGLKERTAPLPVQPDTED